MPRKRSVTLSADGTFPLDTTSPNTVSNSVVLAIEAWQKKHGATPTVYLSPKLSENLSWFVRKGLRIMPLEDDTLAANVGRLR